MAENQYMQMLEDSLDKKIDILRQLQVLCEEQTKILQDPNSTPEELDDNMTAKDALITKLDGLDKGFETMFDRIKEEVELHKDSYRDAIKRMQEKITDITARSSHLQVLEKHNKELARQKFSYVRSQIKELRQSERAVSTYYQNMMKVNTAEPQFMDSKK
jgi:flagellar biosynthesis/type III secretory pathway chaperone